MEGSVCVQHELITARRFNIRASRSSIVMSSIGTRAGVSFYILSLHRVGYANFAVKGNTNTLVKGLKFQSKSSRGKVPVIESIHPNVGSN